MVRSRGQFLAVVPGAHGDKVGGPATELDTNLDRVAAGNSEAALEFLIDIEFAWPESFAGANDGVDAAESEAALGFAEGGIPDVKSCQR